MSAKGPRKGGPILTRDVAPGVHRLEHAHVNCYLVVENGEVTIVDAALPKTWSFLPTALHAIGVDRSQVAALVLTHAHFDHLGFAKHLRDEWRVPVFGHPLESYIAEHPYRYAHENPRAFYPLTHPRGVPILTRMAAAGAFAVDGIGALRGFEPGDTLPVPGSPRVVFSPGHTFGHSALHLVERRTLLSGDALVTLDPYTGRTGPRIVAGAATADSRLALASLDALAATDADIVLPGHGEPWRAGIRPAVTLARAAGPV